MLKKIIVILLLSVAVILAMHQAQYGLQLLVSAHDWIAEKLTQVFSGGEAGNISRQLIALLSVPILIGLIPTLFYWIAKRSWFPYFMDIVWIVWLVQTTAIVMQYKDAVVPAAA